MKIYIYKDEAVTVIVTAESQEDAINLITEKLLKAGLHFRSSVHIVEMEVTNEPQLIYLKYRV